MIPTYKILKGIDEVNKVSLFILRERGTRGYKWKLDRPMNQRNERKYSYPLQVKWNAPKKDVWSNLHP